MPRKTKETTVNEQANLNEKINNLIQNVLDSSDKVTESNKAAKKAKTKSTSATRAKAATTKSAKTKSSESENKEKISKTESKSKTTTRKTTKAKSEEKDEEKKATKKTTKSVKSASSEEKSKTTKKTATTKKVVKATAKTGKTSSKEGSSASTKITSKTKSAKTASDVVVEYYDLPYKYDQTVVKVLYQNPTTLFVYWEISDSDIEYYKKTYGENFFETTRPVLVVHNETMNYKFEVDINDFANSWYFNINDSKCDYRVELIRKPIFYNEKIKTEYVHITSSNKIETPNDRILFSTNEPYTVYFRNTKTNTLRKVNLPKLLEALNLTNKDFGFPIVQNVYDLYKHIYHIEDVGEFSVSLTNPSSGNPSSHSLSSRFIY